MQLAYSTVYQTEILEGLTKVTALVGIDKLLGDATQGGAEVVREPANDNNGPDGSTENTKDNQ